MRKAKLVVIPGGFHRLSLRSAGADGQRDGHPGKVLAAANFQPGEKVVLVAEADLEVLERAAASSATPLAPVLDSLAEEEAEPGPLLANGQRPSLTRADRDILNGRPSDAFIDAMVYDAGG